MPKGVKTGKLMRETLEEMASYRIATRLKGKYNSITYLKGC